MTADRACPSALVHFIFCGFLMIGCNAYSAERTTDIPEVLKPWQGWVTREQEDIRCVHIAQTGGDKHCLWSGTLEIDLDERGAGFKQEWQSFARQWVNLPGSKEHWPGAVTLNGNPAAVVERKGFPAVMLAPGKHTVSGRLRWQRFPQYLPVDANTGLISLKRNGEKSTGELDAQNRLWLRPTGERGQSPESNTLKIEVFRLLNDDIPLGLQTHVRLTVAGEPREIVVGQLLLAETEPMAFHSALPARIEPDGRLRVQARPGEWSITLTARYLKAAETFTMQRLDDAWPDQEIWSFRANPLLRGVKVTGVEGIDPSLIDLPRDFDKLPTYLMNGNSRLALVEDYRGDASPAANQLSLKRSLWLDFKGAGATARDRISGTLTHDWRLRTAADLALGRVTVAGQPQVVTRMPGEPGQGVEIRQAEVSLEAISRIEPLSVLTATGWQHSFDRVDLQLNMPPGWRLWHAGGPDRVASSWLSRWDLWDIFLCLLIVGATLRILGWRWASVSAVTLALTYHQSGAPSVGWIVLVAFIPLLRVLPQGKLRQAARGLVLGVSILFIGAALAFAVEQIRRGLYPQLEQARAINTYPERYKSSAISRKQQLAEEDALLDRVTAQAPAVRSAEKKTPLEPRKRYRPSEKVQTGPGEPTWNWRQVRLSWSGPVRANEPLRLYLSPPWLTRSLNFIQVALVGLFLYGLGRALIAEGGNLPRGSTTSSTPGGNALGIFWLAGAVLLGMATYAPQQALASDFPPQKLLDDLKAELLKPPVCAPHCGSLLNASLRVKEDAFDLRLRAAAQTPLALPLPMGENWRPASLLIDGREAVLTRRQNQLWARLESGVHDLLIRGIVAGDRISFTFPLPLHHVEVVAPGWAVRGVLQGELQGGTLQLQKEEYEQKGDTLLPDPIQPFVRVERVFKEDIDWQLTTTVSRIAPRAGAINVKIPLLEGESMVSQHKVSDQREVLVTLSENQRAFRWHSVLEPADELILKAPETTQWVEHWRVHASPRWHVSGSGIPAVKTPGQSSPLWQPWPGETLKLTSLQPEPVPGPVTTVESVVVDHSPGGRSAALSLTLKIRASLGGDYRLELPVPGALQRIEIDGKEQTRPIEGDQVVVPLRPGVQVVKIEWELAQGINQVVETPAFELPTPASNIDIRLSLPHNRWPLLVRGPDIGPAMLYWGVLVVIVALAIALGKGIKRFDLSIPVHTWQWLLLTIGMSTVNTVGSIPVVLWFFAMEWRRRKMPVSRKGLFNVTQVALIVLSLIALTSLFGTIPQSLLSSPDMQVTGNGSSNFYFQWYQDHSADILPQGWVLSVPLWVYRVAMLLWSLWLAFALLGWAKWGWQCLSTGRFWESSSPEQEK